MPRKLYRCLHVLAGLAILLSSLGIINLMVSLKYETEVNNCISSVDGRDLCATLHMCWLGLAGAVLFVVVSSLLESRIVKHK
jgi:hypothetical protein